MQCAHQHKQMNQKENTFIENANFVRLKKQLLLHCELFGIEGRKRTLHSRNLEEISPFNQKFHKIINANVNAIQKKLWSEFTAWLGT